MHIHNVDFGENFAFQAPKLEQVRRILRQNAGYMIKVREATSDEDQKQSTDMVIGLNGDVAVRIRRSAIPYRDLTIRCGAWGGGKTELDKLRDGWGDWYFYGWEDDVGALSEWMIVDIHQMRHMGMFDKPKEAQPNKDKRTSFVTYKINELYSADALVSALLLRDNQYWHYIVNRKFGNIW